MVNSFHFSILYPFPFNLIITEIIFALPAIPSSFITSYLSKINSDGILAVGFSGFLVILLLSLILGVLVLIEFTGPPPTSEWEEFPRRMLILLILFLYLFFIFPVGLISMFFASIGSTYGNKLLSRIKQSLYTHMPS
jgi:uncharacterized membrane protein YfcA